MSVPTTGGFSMFGATNGSDTTTIQGAIDQGENGSVDGDTQFTQLIAASTVSKFDPAYSGTVSNINQINNANQYRGYPYAGSTTLTQVSLCYHESSSSSACSCSGGTGTYYINTSVLQNTNTTIIATGSSGRPLAPAGFYAKSGSNSVYWNGTSQGGTLSSNTVSGTAGDSFTGRDCGSTNFIIDPPPTYYNYYVASPRLKSATAGSYFSGSGFVMNYNLTSTESNLSNLGGDTLIDPSTGNGYSGQSPADIANNDGFLYAISTTQNLNTQDSGYDDSFVTINSSGVVIEIGLITANNGVQIS